jgi:hypothetical protein
MNFFQAAVGFWRSAFSKDKDLGSCSKRVPITFNFQLLTFNLSLIAFYAALAILITWPLATQMTSRLLGESLGDTYEYIRHVWWYTHAIQTWQPLFEQPLLAYPEGLTSWYLWGTPLRTFPAWLFAFVMPLPAAFNLMILVRLTFNGWSMCWLVRRLTGNTPAALLAGAVYLAYPTFQGQLFGGHPDLIVVWPFPFYIYSLLRLEQHGGWRSIALAAFWFVVSLLGNFVLLIYVVAPLTIFFAARYLLKCQWSAFRRLIIAAVVGGLFALIFILPATLELLSLPQVGDLGGSVDYSADLLAVVSPSFNHPLFGQLQYPRHVLGLNITEGVAYFGIIPALLTLIAVWKVPEARRWLLLTFIAWILSLGPLLKIFNQPVVVSTGGEYETYIPLPWMLFQNLPLISVARTPARFNFVVALSAAIMCGYAIKAISDWLLAISKTKGLTPRREASKTRINLLTFNFKLLTFNLLLIALILYEYQFFWPMPRVRSYIPNEIEDLADQNDLRAVFNVPWNNLVVAKEALYLQTRHQHPLIAGHVTRQTPVNQAMLSVLQGTYDPMLLDKAGVDIIIMHRDFNDRINDFTRESLGEPLFEDERFTMFAAPEAQGEPQFTAVTTGLRRITENANSHFYTPTSGWTTFSWRLQGDGRQVVLSLDGQPISSWMVDGESEFSVPIPAVSEGYHTATLSVEPPCFKHNSPNFECRSVEILDLEFREFTPAPMDAVEFADGLRLQGARIDDGTNELSIALWWRFDQPINENDIRFVHILNDDGQLVAQVDEALGVYPAASQRVDSVSIDIESLPPGEYRVVTGWYTYPDLTRRAVLSGVPGAENQTVIIGQFQRS